MKISFQFLKTEEHCKQKDFTKWNIKKKLNNLNLGRSAFSRQPVTKVMALDKINKKMTTIFDDVLDHD